jgi:DNA polymerase-3 subunit epsilon
MPLPMPQWSDTLAVFDTETTGLDTSQARIVTAFVGLIDAEGTLIESEQWLADPGVAIPEQASAVHGITTEVARRDGRNAGEVVGEIGAALGSYLARGIPVVAYNASYDFSILHHEMVRHGFAPLLSPQPIIDPLVIDRAVDRYRRGKRTLQMATAHYMVRFEDSHTADADAIAAGRVAQAILRAHSSELPDDPQLLHDQQIIWSREWAENFQQFRRSKGDAGFAANGDWPVRL